MNDYLWSILLDNVTYYENGKWVYYSIMKNNYYLRIHCDQLLITDDTTILETLSGTYKGFFRDDIFLLIVCDPTKRIRKIRFRLKCPDLGQCIERLNRHFPVVNQKSIQNVPNICKPEYITLEKALQLSMEISDNFGKVSNLPSNYEEFVKLCLLDPNFPHYVNETKTIFDKLSTSFH